MVRPEKKYSQQQIVTGWCLYDWANSAFVTSVMAAVLPIFFRNVACLSPQGIVNPQATSLWGYTSAAAMLIVAFFSLVLGTAADRRSRRKGYLKIFLFLGAGSTALIALTGRGDWHWVSLLYIAAFTGFACSELFSDSLLPHLVLPGQLDRVSSRGYAFGYAGGGLILALHLALIALLPRTTLVPTGATVPLLAMRLVFLTVTLWWLFFSLPLLRRVPEPASGKRQPDPRPLLKDSLLRLRDTFRHIRRYRDLFLFLLAFWFYNDGIGTIIKMAAAYGDEIGISTLDLVGALLLTQIIGVPCSLLFGRLARQVGTRKMILLGISVYFLISLGGFFMTSAIHFWILAAAVGLVQGGTQALSRSLYATLIPRQKSAEFFSFFNISGKFAGIAGPLLFALAGQLSGSSRFGIASLLVFFLIGGILLLKVDLHRGRRVALAEDSA